MNFAIYIGTVFLLPCYQFKARYGQLKGIIDVVAKQHTEVLNFRASRSQVCYQKKTVPKNLAKFTEKACVGVSFPIKLQPYRLNFIYLKRDSIHNTQHPLKTPRTLLNQHLPLKEFLRSSSSSHPGVVLPFLN